MKRLGAMGGVIGPGGIQLQRAVPVAVLRSPVVFSTSAPRPVAVLLLPLCSMTAHYSH